MSIYNIITIPDPVLKTAASPVSKVDDALRAQLDGMLQTMYDAPGIGLAANQVGLLNRVFVMDLTLREDKEGPRKPVFIINPEIIWESEDISVMEEGCLSIPHQFAEVQRPASVRLKYLDYNGAEQEMLAEGLAAHCVQHELDHLDGILFIDHLSALKRNMILKRVEKMKKQDLL